LKISREEHLLKTTTRVGGNVQGEAFGIVRNAKYIYP